MFPDTLSRASARRFYNLWGQRYDWFGFYEARAKAAALATLNLQPGQCVLNVGAGTGKEHLEIQRAVQPKGLACAVDLSRAMLQAVQARTGAPCCEADGLHLPYASQSFDCLYCAYVLDLVPAAEIPAWLSGFRRVLKDGGVVVLLSLTEGVDAPSRAFVGLWKTAYALSPIACGGCRPLQLSEMARSAGYSLVTRQVVVQLGVPSEILIAQR